MAIYGPETFSLKDGRSLILRHCEPKDVNLLPKFMEQISAESTHTLQYPGKTFDLKLAAEAWGKAVDVPGSIYLGAFSDGAFVGQLILHQYQANHPWTKHIGEFGMMVLKDYWGQGLGSALLERMEALARSVQISRIEATVRTANERGVALYTRRGYEIEGIRRSAAWINGEFQDEYHIAKLLDGSRARGSAAGLLHHVELYVSQLDRSAEFWGWFLEQLGYEMFQSWKSGLSFKLGVTYIVFVQAEEKYRAATYHRKQVGLNHLAFHARSREQVDQLAEGIRSRGMTILYEDRYRQAGGTGNYALFFEDPDRIKVEVVAPAEIVRG